MSDRPIRMPGLGRLRAALRERRAKRAWRNLAGRRLLEAFAERYPRAFFVEIGANDGQHFDHLRDMVRDREWRGIMVEPVPYVFARLRGNYGELAGRIALENAAIADRDGELPLYHLREAKPEERGTLPDWYDSLGSFDRDTVLGHARDIPDIAERLITTQVPTLTFESLCRKHDVGELDLVVVDTEGYDYELLRNVDLTARHPRLLVYEHFHLDPGDRAACREYVEGHGYETMEEGFDTWCLDTAPGDELTRTWRRLSPGIVGVAASDEDREPATR